MRGFNAPLQVYEDIRKLFPGNGDRWAQGCIDAFVSGKFVTLFALLFGIGFAELVRPSLPS